MSAVIQIWAGAIWKTLDSKCLKKSFQICVTLHWIADDGYGNTTHWLSLSSVYSELSRCVFITSHQVQVELKGPLLLFHYGLCVLAVCPAVWADQRCLAGREERWSTHTTVETQSLVLGENTVGTIVETLWEQLSKSDKEVSSSVTLSIGLIGPEKET